jgi:hypothetical protein
MFKVMILVVRSTRGCIMRRIGNEQWSAVPMVTENVLDNPEVSY